MVCSYTLLKQKAKMSQTIYNLVNVYSESTPNPETLKFVTNRLLVEADIFDFATKKDAENSPLAIALFDFDFVKSVFIAQNYVTITRQAGQDWDEVIDLMKDFVKNYLEAGKPVMEAKKADAEPSIVLNDPMSIKINDILTQYVQPAVEQDGGAISFKDFDAASGRVTVVLKGSCKGCPSSMVTLKSGIENLLKRMVPEVTEVVAADVD